MLKVAANVLIKGTLAEIENTPIIGPLFIAPTKAIIELTVKVCILAVTILTAVVAFSTTLFYLTHESIRLVCYTSSKVVHLISFLFQKTCTSN